MIDVPAAAAVSAGDEDNDGRDDATRVYHCSLPKRVILCFLECFDTVG